MKISVNSKVRLNGVGILGSILFVGGALLGSFVYANSLEAAARNISLGIPPRDMGGIMLFVMGCSGASLIGFVMVLVGREYDHTVEINKEQPPQA